MFFWAQPILSWYSVMAAAQPLLLGNLCWNCKISTKCMCVCDCVCVCRLYLCHHYFGECTASALLTGVLLFVWMHVLSMWGGKKSLEPQIVFGSLLFCHSYKCQLDGSHVSSNCTLPTLSLDTLVFPGRPPDGSWCDVVLGCRSGAAKTDESGSKRPLSHPCQALIEMDGGERITSSTWGDYWWRCEGDEWQTHPWLSRGTAAPALWLLAPSQWGLSGVLMMGFMNTRGLAGGVK